jgi:Holliday junction resolvase RusA-like endonuclease
MIRFTVPGEPVAKGRPRIGRMANGRPVNITPGRTRSYEALVALAAQQAMAGRDPYAASVPLSVLVVATMPIPASWSARKQLAAADQLVLPTKRPDLDNFVKSALDGCNGVVFADDSAVVRLETRKEYGRTPGLTVQIVPLNTVEGG